MDVYRNSFLTSVHHRTASETQNFIANSDTNQLLRGGKLSAEPRDVLGWEERNVMLLSTSTDSGRRVLLRL